MSTYWGYRCKQDGIISDTWFNHGEQILRCYAECWPLIRQISEKDKCGYIEVTIMAHAHVNSEIFEFLHDHYEHGVELYNEYDRSEPLEECKDE
jgi:hypothetical protein